MRLMFLFFCTVLFFACKTDTKVESQFMDKEENKTVMKTESSIALSKVMGQFEPAKDQDFTLVEKKYADRTGMYIQKETYDAFKEMWAHAQKEGVELVIRSATRNFDYQKGIWERKWTGQTKVSGDDLSKTMPNHKERALEILHYSSMPGTSRHHWGTDIDFNSFDNNYFESGTGLKVYNWLVKNAPNYGFFRPYTEKGTSRPHGYEEEKWHWSYNPLASQYMTTATTKLKNEMIQGFKGSETAIEIDVVDKYVKGVGNIENQK